MLDRDTEASSTWERSRAFGVSIGFSKHHAALLDICFGRYFPPVEKVQNLSQGCRLEDLDIEKLAYMVLVEFAASVEKERKGLVEESRTKPEPRPYDVFVMKTTLGAQSTNVYVLLPLRGGELAWWDGDSHVEPLRDGQPIQPAYRIASLSGSARVLACLDSVLNGRNALSADAMERRKLIDVIVQDSASISLSAFSGVGTLFDPSILDPLNESQANAVRTVASERFQDGFFAIQGPPGCGKTTTMVGMIAAIGTGMIVTAPSNAAVANLALKLVATDRFSFPHICVFGDGCDKSVSFLSPRHRSDAYRRALAAHTKLVDQEIKPGPNFEDETMRRDRGIDQVWNDLANWLHVSTDLSKVELRQMCPDIALDENNSVSKMGMRVLTQIIEFSDVILCTLNSSGSSFLQQSVARGRFQTLLLDEGGQCTEAEFFLATSFPGIKRIVVMGDPKQLNPTVLEPRCRLAGFGHSWLGRVYTLFPSKIHLLDTQYRMDPAILKFPNKRFYGGRIQSGANVLNRSPDVHNPFCLVDTQCRGREERDENSSFRNSYEIGVIRDLLKNDTDIVTLVHENKQARVIIITPYKAQATLLQEMTRHLEYCNLQVSTVDSFQGQEGDVVILSTVRTKSVGFIDDDQRLNVALTRAKRVLRVVGDTKFFESLGRNSTLRALARYANIAGIVEKTKMQSIAACPPDLSMSTLWKMTLTQRFHNELSMLQQGEKHVALNTLFALALPDLNALGINRVLEKDGWHTSWMKGYPTLRVIWVVRDHEGLGIVEAHHAGSIDSCLRFRQKHHVAPDGCRIPLSDMSGLVLAKVEPPENGRMFVTWPLDSYLQDAILSGKLEDLPLSKIQLDPPQERIARSPPPLLIESRSGTGKTLVLLQHAAFYMRASDPRPALFVTVSPRLRNELEQKYGELTPIHGAGLPRTEFFSFRDFVVRLLSYYGIDDFENAQICRLSGYFISKTTYEKIPIEPHLLENEIGGVIMGSVAAAQQQKALTRDQYLIDNRSNIPNKTEEGRKKRHLVYDEYGKYSDWKKSANKYDIHDVVLRLLEGEKQQLFASAYLDEVQDLSHAAIFLICGLAGRDNHHWVCGGDPAQMISPGCCFTFDGLKQTLLKLESGIEQKIKKVHHLVVNYRTTKDILALGNEILSNARKFFPGAIDFAQPERARKDLGLKVVICSWKAARNTEVKFGQSQAFIYSGSNTEEVISEANDWLNEHPFILSSLDSKGLEFDDVVVAFTHDRKVWQVEHKREASLSMLRELYVAVTRAQKRVVILVRDAVPDMMSFFNSLACDLETSDGSIFAEFNCETSEQEWFERARKLFGNHQFKFAASCFTRAGRQDWSFLAQGHNFMEVGAADEADRELRKSARIFYEASEFQKVLEILLLLLGLMRQGVWEVSDDKIFSASLASFDNFLSRADTVRYAILREDFSAVVIDDLKDEEVSELLQKYHQAAWLKQLVAGCTDSDREAIAASMPVAVIDFYTGKKAFHEACEVALRVRKYDHADSATSVVLENYKKGLLDASGILRVVDLWNTYGPADLSKVLHPSSKSCLLFLIFRSPTAMSSSMKVECTKVLGRDIVLLAVNQSKVDRTILLDFDALTFKVEVDAALIAQVEPDLIDVVHWYEKNNHPALASQFAQERKSDWNNDDLLRMAMMFWSRPKWLFQELELRGLLAASLVWVTVSPAVRPESKERYLHGHLVFSGRLLQDQTLGDDAVARNQNQCFYEHFGGVHINRAALTMLFRQDPFDTTPFHYGPDGTRLFRQGPDGPTLVLPSWLAVENSWMIVGTFDQADRHLTRLLRLWNEGTRILSLPLPAVATARFEDKYSFLMCLFFAMEPSRRNRDILLNDPDASGGGGRFASLVMVFGPSAAAYCKMHVPPPGRPCSQDDALLARLVSHHAELRRVVQARRRRLEGDSEGSTGETVEDGNADGTTTMATSKKGARKKKKDSAKQQQQQQTGNQSISGKGNDKTGGGGGGGGGNSNNNNNNNKKKKKNNNRKKRK